MTSPHSRSLHLHRHLYAAAAAFLVLAGTGCATTGAEPAWPEKVVGINQMQPTQRIQTSLMVNRLQRSPAATVVLRLHVDKTGKVVRLAVLESSDVSTIDGAGLKAMRKMTFAPFLDNGTAVPVTVVAPLHFPETN